MDTSSPLTTSRIFEAYEHGLLSVRPKEQSREPKERVAISAAGSALVSRAIADDPSLAATYTWASNLTLVVSDGSAVHGLGDLGCHAVLPILEAKCAFFKSVANLDAIPLAFTERNVDSIVDTLVRIRPSYGAVSIEDVSAPTCFELEQRLKETLSCPVIHNDQHGTAVAVTAALRNASRLLGRTFTGLRTVIVGAGAAGIATARMLSSFGICDLILVDSRGIINSDRPGLAGAKLDVSRNTNPRKLRGGLADAIIGADVLIGLSSARIDRNLLRLMHPQPIILALSNPEPEVTPEDAARVGALYGSGRSESRNCVSSLLAIPGILRGANESRAREITGAMLHAAVAGLESANSDSLSWDSLMPDLFDPKCCDHVSQAVAAAAATA